MLIFRSTRSCPSVTLPELLVVTCYTIGWIGDNRCCMLKVTCVHEADLLQRWSWTQFCISHFRVLSFATTDVRDLYNCSTNVRQDSDMFADEGFSKSNWQSGCIVAGVVQGVNDTVTLSRMKDVAGCNEKSNWVWQMQHQRYPKRCTFEWNWFEQHWYP